MKFGRVLEDGGTFTNFTSTITEERKPGTPGGADTDFIQHE